MAEKKLYARGVWAGEAKTKRKIAEKMKAEGFSMEQIRIITELTETEIKETEAE